MFSLNKVKLRMEIKTKRGILYIYLNNLLRGVAFSLVGIFIPIYFLTLGFSLSQVFGYFLVLNLFSFLLARKMGYKLIIISSAFLVILFLILLTFLDTLNISIYFIGAILGVQD